MTLSGGMLDVLKRADVEVFSGGVDDLDLESMLDVVPADLQGEKGIKKDERGVERMKQRQAAIEAAAEEKAELLIAQEAAEK